MGKKIDLTGKRFGMLVVIGTVDKTSKRREPYWLCRCDCGKERIVRGSNLRSGNTKSCGCNQFSGIGKNHFGASNSNYKYGITGHRLYIIWSSMKQRCNNPNAHEYTAYGGRGIKVCDEWLHDAKAFYDWAMANGYADDLTIDRIENDKGYSPDNCRWIPQSEQYSNMRNSR